jgi:membrane associated rhomboid family serine protease
MTFEPLAKLFVLRTNAASFIAYLLVKLHKFTCSVGSQNRNLLVLQETLSRRLTLIAITAIILLGGGCIWALGQSGTVYIGASGVIFGLIGFLLTVGIFRKERIAIIVSIFVLVFYAGTLRMLFQLQPGISWAAHFWGMFFGIATAWFTRYSQPRVS